MHRSALVFILFLHEIAMLDIVSPRANGAKRRSGRKPGARVTNFVLGELKVVDRDTLNSI